MPAPDSNYLDVVLKSSVGVESKVSLKIQGQFDTSNKELAAALDWAVNNISEELRSKKGEKPLIQQASLAIGYLHVLCSTTAISEHVFTWIDGDLAPNVHKEYNLAAHFKFLVVCRLVELVSDLLAQIRLENGAGDARGMRWGSNAYAAACILRYEILGFRSRLRESNLLHVG